MEAQSSPSASIWCTAAQSEPLIWTSFFEMWTLVVLGGPADALGGLGFACSVRAVAFVHGPVRVFNSVAGQMYHI